jgi:hypothetical protein
MKSTGLVRSPRVLSTNFRKLDRLSRNFSTKLTLKTTPTLYVMFWLSNSNMKTTWTYEMRAKLASINIHSVQHKVRPNLRILLYESFLIKTLYNTCPIINRYIATCILMFQDKVWCCTVSVLMDHLPDYSHLWQTLKGKVKVKQSHYRHWQALRAPGGRGSQVFRQSAHEGGKVVSPNHRPPLPPRKDSWVLISVRGWVDLRAIVRPKRLCQWKIPVTPSGIEPATFQFVAQCLNQLCHRVPPQLIV